MAFMGEGMSFFANGEVGGSEGFLNGVDELGVRNGTPAICGWWCVDILDFMERNVLGTAVKDQVG